jgi:hypothetical protein
MALTMPISVYDRPAAVVSETIAPAATDLHLQAAVKRFPSISAAWEDFVTINEGETAG